MITSISTKVQGREFITEDGSRNIPVDGYINKPAQPEELLKKVKELLKKR